MEYANLDEGAQPPPAAPRAEHKSGEDEGGECSVEGCSADASGTSGLCGEHRSSVVGGWAASNNAPRWAVTISDFDVVGEGRQRKHAVYVLQVRCRETSETWEVRRRYEHFRQLQRELEEKYPDQVARARLPGKAFSGTSASAILARRIALPVFLHQLQRTEDICDERHMRVFVGAEGRDLSAYERHYGAGSALIQGSLDKRAEVLRRLPGTWWKRRFCVATSNRLELNYYDGEDEDPTKPLFVIPLFVKGLPVEVLDASEELDTPYAFKIVSERTHWFRCETAQEMRQWVDTLQPDSALASSVLPREPQAGGRASEAAGARGAADGVFAL